jgi:hypothetical protein
MSRNALNSRVSCESRASPEGHPATDWRFWTNGWTVTSSGSSGIPTASSVERDLHRYQRAEDIDHDEPFIGVGPRHVQRVVKTVTGQTAECTGNDDFQKVSSHDLRRYFAHTCLVESLMNNALNPNAHRVSLLDEVQHEQFDADFRNLA